MLPSQTLIRASALTYYTDCARRSVARMFPFEIKSYGFDLTEVTTGVAARVGTATHRVFEEAIRLRKAGEVNAARLSEVAEASLAETSEEVRWDRLTADKDAAIVQAVRQAEAALEVLPAMDTVETEGEFTANLGDGFTFSGHIDIRGDAEKAIFDLKTGITRRANMAQYGGYALLARSNGHLVQRLGEIFVQRVSVKKPQPAATLIEFNVNEAEKIAWHTIQRIKEDMQRFRERGGDPWVFAINPNSMMCGAGSCPAFSTNFCGCKLSSVTMATDEQAETPAQNQETAHA